ncbi:MAG: hypothetical protein Q8P41_19190 [Pseudomonadota bacterium]|nr:hypothetical protein [Pseudomonadota bacterium]
MAPTILILALGCAYNEELPEKDILGTVIVPAAAATRLQADGTTATDPRFIGPIFLGAYSGIDTVSFGYPHPSMGPIVTADTPGDAFPYGGTTVGRYDFACYESLACKVVTGRFSDYNDMLEYFGTVLGSPIQDDNGADVANGSTFQQACYDYFYATSDQEMAFLGDLDFALNADGDFEAAFVMPHTVFVEGMTIWGWMDAPEIVPANPTESGGFSSCDVSTGREFDQYDENFREGRVYFDALNTPSQYIYAGDWVASGAEEAVVNSPDDKPVVRLDFGFGVGEAE